VKRLWVKRLWVVGCCCSTENVHSTLVKHSKVVSPGHIVHKIKNTQLSNVSPGHIVHKIKNTQLSNVSPVHIVHKINNTQLLYVSPVHIVFFINFLMFHRCTKKL